MSITYAKMQNVHYFENRTIGVDVLGIAQVQRDVIRNLSKSPTFWAGGVCNRQPTAAGAGGGGAGMGMGPTGTGSSMPAGAVSTSIVGGP